MTVTALLAPITAEPGPVHLPAANDWMQGRTLYGGASALIAYTAAARHFPELPPLRSAQIAFVAPVGDTFETRVEMVRQGRNVTQVRSELLVDGKVALSAFLVFGTEREPNALHPAPTADPWPGSPEENEALPPPKEKHFIANYEIRRAQDSSGPGEPVVRRWFRLREDAELDPVSLLILIGDTLPPGSMRAMQRRGPLSSINWTLNILNPQASTRDGWWLAETASDHADHGYSSERLRLWNAEGELVMAGMQAAAIFG
jgi:acyl-CoA thioesterase